MGNKKEVLKLSRNQENINESIKMLMKAPKLSYSH